MRIKTYRHQIRSSAPVAGIGTAYDKTKRIALTMGAFPPGSAFLGRLHSIIFQFSSIVTAANMTFRLTSDLDGDETLITDTSSTLDNGVTTSADGSAAFKIDLDVGLASGDTIYVFTKLNAGSATLDRVVLCWEE